MLPKCTAEHAVHNGIQRIRTETKHRYEKWVMQRLEQIKQIIIQPHDVPNKREKVIGKPTDGEDDRYGNHNDRHPLPLPETENADVRMTGPPPRP